MLRIALLFLSLCCSLSYAADPTRFEDQVRAYEALDAPKGAMVLAGSSTIKLWKSIEADLAPLVVVPRGLVGSQVPDWDYYLQRLVLVHQPSSVVLYIGDNDINVGKTPQTVADGLKGIAQRISVKYPTAHIHFIAIKPSIARWDQWPLSKQANQLIKSFAATDARYHYIDASPALLGADGKPIASLYANDGIHLTVVDGYKAWTSIVRPALLKAPVPKIPMPPEALTIGD